MFLGSAPTAVGNDSHLVSYSLDKLLDSGLYTGEITELSGGPGSGKSQVNVCELLPPSLIIPFFSTLA